MIFEQYIQSVRLSEKPLGNKTDNNRFLGIDGLMFIGSINHVGSGDAAAQR
ncbi:hypothetical protein D3C85_986090 [compost metagenome]